jgi:hypothetical protein
VTSLWKTSGRSDDMVVQSQTTNLEERQRLWETVFRVGLTKRLEEAGVKTDTQRLLLGNPSIVSTILLTCY